MFEKYYVCGDVNFWKSRMMSILKTMGPTNPADPSNMFWKSCIWDQYLPGDMKWKFGIEYGINIHQKHEIDIFN